MTNVYCGKFWCVLDDGNTHQYVKAETREEGTALLEAMETDHSRLVDVDEVGTQYSFEMVGTVNGKETTDRVGTHSTSDKKAIRSAISMFKTVNGGFKRGKRRKLVEVTSYTFTKKTALERLPEHYFDRRDMV